MCLVRCSRDVRTCAHAGLGIGVVVALVLGVVLGLVACHRPVSREREREREREEAGTSVSVSVTVASHGLAQPATGRSSFIVLTDTPPAALDAALASPAIQKLRAGPNGPVVTVERRAAADVSLPHPETLGTVAPTLSAADRARFGTAKWALLVDAVVPNPAASSGAALRAALAMTAALAQAAKGGKVDAPLIYDLDGRRVVTADEQLRRVREVEATANLDALVQSQLALHRYDDAAGTRLLTLNLHAFGLADLAIDGADPADVASLAPVLAHAALALHRAVVEGNAVAPLHLGTGAGDLLVDLVRAPRQDDDPDNMVYRLVPATAASANEPLSPAARAHALLGAGAASAPADEARPVSHDPAVLAASSRARASFPDAVRRWRARPGTVLEAEIPFHGTAGQTEWMWMTVDARDEQTHELRGRLLNEPTDHAAMPGLTAFSPVTNDGAELFDWRLLSPDGGTEGGETLRLLR